MDFIPAQHSKIFTKIFRVYTEWLFKWRFKRTWIHQQYNPTQHDRTVYFLNHTSWWDGLIPLMLNEYRFRQHASALMELKQMQRYPFFKWLGTFSINIDDPAHRTAALRYAVHHLQKSGSSLFIYPEGEIRANDKKLRFQPGIGWLAKQLPGVKLVPIGIHMHTVRYNRPELHLWVDDPIEIKSAFSRDAITQKCEKTMESVLDKLFETAGFDDTPYERFL